MNKELISLMGYTQNLSPMKKAKVEKTLSKLIRYENIVMNISEFVTRKIIEGSTPAYEENYSYYSKKIDGYTKPKTLYKLSKDSCYNEITKTEYDYALWLIDNDITTPEAYEDAKKQEEQRLLNIEKQLQEEENERIRVQKELQQKEDDFKIWLEEESKKYDNEKNIALAKKIYLEYIGQSNNDMINRILTLIDNMDNIHCKDTLINWLHNDNKASIKVFECITGLKLPKTNKERREYLRGLSKSDYKESIEFTPRNKATEKELIEFKIRVGNDISIARGEKLNNKYGLNLYIQYSNDGYAITEGSTGMLLVHFKPTKKELMEAYSEALNDSKIDRLRGIIKTQVDKLGSLNQEVA